MQLKPIRTKRPALALLETADARKHCNVDHSDDDTYIAALVGSVTDHLEAPAGILRVCLLRQTWQLPMSGFPLAGILLPLEPILAVTSIEYIAEGATTWSTFAADQWEWFTNDLGSWIVPVDGADWPATANRATAVRITFDAGHAKQADVPQSIVHAARLLVAHFYENREETVLGVTAQTLPMGVGPLLRPFFRIPV